MKEEVSTAAPLDLRAGLLQAADGPKLLRTSQVRSEAEGACYCRAWQNTSFKVGLQEGWETCNLPRKRLFPLWPVQQWIQTRFSKELLQISLWVKGLPCRRINRWDVISSRKQGDSASPKPCSKTSLLAFCFAGVSTDPAVSVGMLHLSSLWHDWLNSILQLVGSLSTFLSSTLHPFNLCG